MRFKVKCLACSTYGRTFDTPDQLAEWLDSGWKHDHPEHKRYSVYCDFKPIYPEVKTKTVNFAEGDEYIFVTRAGQKDNIVALGPDGRIALFDRVAPLTHELTEGLRVRSEIIKIGESWMIVTPLEIVGMASPLDTGMPELYNRRKRSLASSHGDASCERGSSEADDLTVQDLEESE